MWFMFCHLLAALLLFLPPEAQLQWHSRLARRTYKSVTTKKCEGREFEPLLEQRFYEYVVQSHIVCGNAHQREDKNRKFRHGN